MRKRAAEALGIFGDAQAFSPLVLAQIKEMDGKVRAKIVEALGKFDDPRAVNPLITALMDRDELVREQAVKGLGKLDWKPTNNEAGAAYWIAEGNWDKCVMIGAPAFEPLLSAIKIRDLRRYAAWALGKLGDVRAVDPLIAVLNDENRDVRQSATEALGNIGDTRAVKPLLATLNDHEIDVRKTAAEALDKIGYNPSNDETSAFYWIAKQNWGKCVSIGRPAVLPLINALEYANPFSEKAALVLDEIGWQPGDNKTGAVYWIAKHNWEETVRTGASSVELLINRLTKYSDRWAANLLIHLYQSGQLNLGLKKLILSHRREIMMPHMDYGAEDIHEDLPAIEFPL